MQPLSGHAPKQSSWYVMSFVRSPGKARHLMDIDAYLQRIGYSGKERVLADQNEYVHALKKYFGIEISSG
jgi:hypothetical protein